MVGDRLVNWKCNSCGGTYSDTQADGTMYYHVCSPETITPGTFDATGKVLTPEKRTQRTTIRDERITPGIFYKGVDGVVHPMPFVLDSGGNHVPVQAVIRSEGLGRTALV